MESSDHLYAFELDSHNAFEVLSQFETNIKSGDWLYFNQSKNSVQALFKSEVKIESDFIINSLNKDFIDIFLGRFSNKLSQGVEVLELESFFQFCFKLNTCLNEGVKIFDLSRTQLWIWLESDSDTKKLAPKLKDFIS